MVYVVEEFGNLVIVPGDLKEFLKKVLLFCLQEICDHLLGKNGMALQFDESQNNISLP